MIGRPCEERAFWSELPYTFQAAFAQVGAHVAVGRIAPPALQPGQHGAVSEVAVMVLAVHVGEANKVVSEVDHFVEKDRERCFASLPQRCGRDSDGVVIASRAETAQWSEVLFYGNGGLGRKLVAAEVGVEEAEGTLQFGNNVLNRRPDGNRIEFCGSAACAKLREAVVEPTPCSGCVPFPESSIRSRR